MYIRSVFQTLQLRILESRKFIQVVSGPRQVGKTTGIRQILKKMAPIQPSLFLSADEPLLRDQNWLRMQWEKARKICKKNSSSYLLVIDEIQKITNWSETVKSLWDEDTALQIPLKIIILGSSTMLIHHGLSESLVGRFELTRVTHWNFAEMRDAFNYSIEDWIYFGGYPGASSLKDEPSRWKSYIKDSIIEPTISQDVFQMERVNKPALFRRLLETSIIYSSQILSYQKMLGQLQESGNATTIAHYLNLLGQAGLIAGLEKYSGSVIRKKASSPKLQVLDNSLMSAMEIEDKNSILEKPEKWGRWVESAIGVFLFNSSIIHKTRLEYWRHRSYEVDFILSYGKELIAIEVKSGSKKSSLSGLKEFKKQYPSAKVYIIGTSGIPIDEFLNSSVLDLF